MIKNVGGANSTKYAPYLTRSYVDKLNCPVLMKNYTLRLMIAKHDPQDFISVVAVLVVEIMHI